jgi:predicted nucleic acid-binding protein
LVRIYLDADGPHRAWPEVLDLARSHGITVRDAADLDLALRLNLPLATSDPQLTQAAGAAGVPIFTP